MPYRLSVHCPVWAMLKAGTPESSSSTVATG